MIVERLPVGAFGTNSYIAACSATRDAAVIDPGGGAAEIASRARDLSLRVAWIINTHGHGDHIASNRELKAAFPEARIAVNEADAAYLEDPELNLSASFGAPVTSPPADVLLHDGDELRVGKLTFRALHVPGHTPGGTAFYVEEANGAPALFCGDTLFAGSIGRTDLPGGRHDQLIPAIRERLLCLPHETIVYPGHGETTTIGEEAASNPFLA